MSFGGISLGVSVIVRRGQSLLVRVSATEGNLKPELRVASGDRRSGLRLPSVAAAVFEAFVGVGFS